MKKFSSLLFVALLGVWGVGVAEPLVSINNTNPLTSDVGFGVYIYPLDGNLSPVNQIDALRTPVDFATGQSSVQVQIPASPTPYKFVGVRIWYRVARGTGIAPVYWAAFDHSQAAKVVPAGTPMNCVYSAPPLITGDLTCTLGTDTVPPSPPSSLAAVSPSLSTINLTWAAATDNVGVASYRVERCQAAPCTGFATIGSSTVLAFGDTGLTSGQSYSYRVTAADAAGNLSDSSNVATATVLTPPPPPPPPPPPTGGPVFTVLASDAFPGTALGPAWATAVGVSPFKVVAGAATPTSVTADCGARYAGAMVIPAGQYSRGNLFVSGSGGNRQGIGFMLRQSPSARTNYRFVIDHAATNNASITKRVAGTGRSLVQWTMPFTDGDQVTFAISAAGVLYVFDKNGGIAKIFDDSAAQIVGGTVGIEFSSNATSASIRNWEGGSFSP